MLKSLKIKNILSHKNTMLKFDPGVNMIIGPSDHGKSVIVHSIIKCATNRPTGEGIRNRDGGEMVSRVSFTDGTKVQFSNDKQNKYHIKIPKRKAIEYKAFGAKPPQEVTDCFNFHKKINIQTQFEPIFLVSESPGEVASFFNEMANLEVINDTLKKAKEDVRATEAKLNFKKEEIKTKRDDLKAYDGLYDFKKLVHQAEKVKEEIRSNENETQTIASHCEQVIETQSVIAQFKTKTKIKGKVNQAIKLKSKIESISNEMELIINDTETVTFVSMELKNLKRKQKISSDINMALVLNGVIKETQEEINEYTDAIEKLDQLIFLLIKRKKETTIMKKEFNKEFPPICPLCGSKKEES